MGYKRSRSLELQKKIKQILKYEAYNENTTKVDKGMLVVNQDTTKRDEDVSKVDENDIKSSFNLTNAFVMNLYKSHLFKQKYWILPIVHILIRRAWLEKYFSILKVGQSC